MAQDLIPEGTIDSVNLREALEERYLAYALSTIMHRALPDVRDGLKPVHRRVLYAMRLLKLDPGSGFKKCARVVGDVIGKYHPHGDQSVYDALARLAQDFSQRYPLVDGQGNFGNIDGDNPAAMRYTEARLTEVAKLLLDGLDEDSVDFRQTYDGEESEPVVLPGAFPNLLANGSSGIAVGMATSIPPHNVAELCDAAMYLIDKPDAPIEKLVDFVQGPDFPTGGTLVDDPASITEAYRTGRGSFRVRAKWYKEDQGRGNWVIVVTQIPYMVQKSRLIEKLAELITNKRLPLLADVRDESAEDIRIVLEPRTRNVPDKLLMESIFKLTDLESRFSLNMNVLTQGKVPQVLGLKETLQQWLEHRREVLQRRSKHRLEQIRKRLELLDGYLIAYLNIDEVIRIIREDDDPKAELCRRFGLNDIQADAVLNLRLRALRKLEEMEIRKEHETLSAERDGLEALLADAGLQWARIKEEVASVKKTFDRTTPLGRRRTDFGTVEDVGDEMMEALVEREPITVVISEKGWIRALKGHIADVGTVSFKAGDALATSFLAETTDKVMVVASDGKVYTIPADKLPGGRTTGEPVRLHAEIDESAEILTIFKANIERKLLLVASDGYGFVAKESDLIATTRKGKQVMNLGEGAKFALLVPVEGDHVAMIGDNRKLVIFPLADVPELGRGKGVRLQRYKDGGVTDARTFKAADGLTWYDTSDRAYTRSMTELAEWVGERGAAGRLPPPGFPKSRKFGGKGNL